jgi:hypothetical protein
MIGATKDGRKIEKETDVKMFLRVPAQTHVAMKFGVI